MFITLVANIFIKTLVVFIILDSILGVLRAFKDKKFNSSAGIDGGIRKTAMLASVLALWFVDQIVHINLLFMIPKTWLEVLGTDRIGICETFCILFVLFEFCSVLKNMVKLNLPIPKKIKNWVEKTLDEFTDELGTSAPEVTDVPKEIPTAAESMDNGEHPLGNISNSQ